MKKLVLPHKIPQENKSRTMARIFPDEMRIELFALSQEWIL
jgi:hypothetical protein